MEEKKYLTILGLGNILLTDEGFGVHFARMLEEKYSFPEKTHVIDGGTLGYSLLDTIAGTRNLIVIDTIKTDDTPGSIYRFTRAEMELKMPDPTSAHEVEFFDVLNQAELIGDSPETVFLCIVPYEYGELNLEMTEQIKNRFQKMEELALTELKKLNIIPEIKNCA